MFFFSHICFHLRFSCTVETSIQQVTIHIWRSQNIADFETPLPPIVCPHIFQVFFYTYNITVLILAEPACVDVIYVCSPRHKSEILRFICGSTVASKIRFKWDFLVTYVLLGQFISNHEDKIKYRLRPVLKISHLNLSTTFRKPTIHKPSCRNLSSF